MQHVLGHDVDVARRLAFLQREAGAVGRAQVDPVDRHTLLARQVADPLARVRVDLVAAVGHQQDDARAGVGPFVEVGQRGLQREADVASPTGRGRCRPPRWPPGSTSRFCVKSSTRIGRVLKTIMPKRSSGRCAAKSDSSCRATLPLDSRAAPALAEVVVQHLGAVAASGGAGGPARSPGPCCGCGRAAARSRRPARRARPAYSGRYGPASATSSSDQRQRAQQPQGRSQQLGGAVARHQGQPARWPDALADRRQQRQQRQRQQPQHPGVVERQPEFMPTPRSASRQRRHRASSQALVVRVRRGCTAEELARASAAKKRASSSRSAAKRGRRAMKRSSPRSNSTSPRASGSKRLVQAPAGLAPPLGRACRAGRPAQPRQATPNGRWRARSQGRPRYTCGQLGQQQRGQRQRPRPAAAGVQRAVSISGGGLLGLQLAEAAARPASAPATSGATIESARPRRAPPRCAPPPAKREAARGAQLQRAQIGRRRGTPGSRASALLRRPPPALRRATSRSSSALAAPAGARQRGIVQRQPSGTCTTTRRFTTSPTR